MKKQLGIALFSLALISGHSVSAEPPVKPKKAAKKARKPKVSSEFDWKWPDNREQAVSACGQYLEFMRPKMALLSGEAQAHFKLHLDIAEALLKHLQSISKKNGFRMDAKRCRSELIRAERLLGHNRKKPVNNNDKKTAS